MAIWKADKLVHCHPCQRAHEELAPHGIRAANQHHLRVKRSEVCLGIFHSCERHLRSYERVRSYRLHDGCENGMGNSLGGVKHSRSSVSRLPSWLRNPWRNSSFARHNSSFLAYDAARSTYKRSCSAFDVAIAS